MTTIYLVRHGEYENPGYLFPGRLPEFPLSERGRSQVQQLGQYFVTKHISALYSSPLLRTRQTAEIIADEIGVPVVFDDRLLEVRTMAEGISMNRFDEVNGGLSYTPEYHAKGAESLEQLTRRMVGFIEEKLIQHAGEEVIVISHGDPIRFGVLHYMRSPITFEASRAIATPLAGGYQIDMDEVNKQVQIYPIVAS